MMTSGEQELDCICENYIQGICQPNNQCPRVHFPLPYLWQLNFTPFGGSVYSFSPEISYQIESHYCDPNRDGYTMEQPLEVSDCLVLENVSIHFDSMLASVSHPEYSGFIAVNRLSTMSYAIPLLAERLDLLELHCSKFYTQWRWYWFHSEDKSWKVFGLDCQNPDQQTLETKYCWPHRQLNYRFEGTDGMDFVIEFESQKRCMSALPFILQNPATKDAWPVRRRPVFSASGSCPQWPPIKCLPYVVSFPSKWTPLDRTSDWEAVKLSRSGDEFRAVATEFLNSIASDKRPKRKVKDVFRLQNPFVWQKYINKRSFMEANGNLDERYLFHGTQMEGVVKGICRHSFDMRCYGVNNICYGKGAYFAVQSSYSDKYAYKAGRRRNWMFLARVLVGKYAFGKREMTRPPPVDPCRPFAELYDSCVDDTFHPKIFVTFDSDQSYPDYIIGYADADAQGSFS